MTGWRKAPLISEMPPARVIPPELGVCVSETQRGSMHMIVWISVKSRVCVGVWMNVWDYVCWQMGVNGHPTICTHPTHNYTHNYTQNLNSRGQTWSTKRLILINVLKKKKKVEEPPLGCMHLCSTPVFIHVCPDSSLHVVNTLKEVHYIGMYEENL